ncbi:LapB repeat-containing protein [Listeria marthii]|uniref:LapB repeat-containing protein n=1 Tax=Listeria marthii TaxID=529731 RepID=UPI001886C91B|nr:LapB repeat-containing protein [Listeria marthii]MBF2515273.1 LapB repeat-containing protein [Listeria marthii]
MKRKVGFIIAAGMILFQSFNAYPLAALASENEEKPKEATPQKVGNLKATLPQGSTYQSLFPDEALALAVVKAATGSENTSLVVTQADLNKVTTLTAVSKGITNLAGIEYLTQLTSLDLRLNQITNFTLKGTNVLPELTSINLTGNDLTKIDIQDQPKLTKVATDTQGSAELTEVVLKNLPALKQAGTFADGGLDIINFATTPTLTKVTLENLPAMTDIIELNGCGITELSVKNLAEAKSVNLFGNKVTTLAGLENLPNLTNIYASKNELTELESLKSFPNMTGISVNNNHISVLPENLTTKAPLLNVINATNQTVTLSEKAGAGKIAFDNEIKNFGQSATPKNISNQGVYTNNQFKWNAENLEGVTTVDFEFDDYVTNPAIQGTFSGKVTVPVKIVDLPVITANAEMSYDKNASVTEAQFLASVSATATEGATITSDFRTAVDFTKAGSYEVTLNAKNTAGYEAEPVKVTVRVAKSPAPVITANAEISYMQFANITAANFLSSIQATTNDSSVITTNLDTVVDWNVVGDYVVTLNSTNGDGVAATPVTVTVRVTQAPAPQMANVTFDIDDVQTTEAIVVEGLITEPAAPTKEGYTFEGWFDAKTGGNKWNFATSKMPTAGVTLYAQFSEDAAEDPNDDDGNDDGTDVNVVPVVTENNGDPTDPTASNDCNGTDDDSNKTTGKQPATGDSQNMLFLLAGLLLVGVSFRIFKKAYSK